MTREEELEALFPKMAILTSKSLTASSLLLYSMRWTFLTIDDPLWGSNIFFSEGPPVVNKYIFIEHSGLGLKVEITRVKTKLRNCLHRFLSGQNTLIWPLHIPMISQSVIPPSNSKLGQTPPNFSKLPLSKPVQTTVYIHSVKRSDS